MASPFIAGLERVPCLSIIYLWRGEGMGLFKRTYLSDQNNSILCRGPSRGLHDNALMESISFLSSRQQGGPLAPQELMRPGEECCAEPPSLILNPKVRVFLP
jgi:hypothetical protein